MDINQINILLDLSFQIAKNQADADFKLNNLTNVSLIDETIKNFNKLKKIIEK